MPDHPPTALTAPEFEYLEDPAIIQTLTLMSRQWPLLAGAADHPLTEHFIHRAIRRKTAVFRQQFMWLIETGILSVLAFFLAYCWIFYATSPANSPFQYLPRNPLLIALGAVVLPGSIGLLFSFLQHRSRRRSLAAPEAILFMDSIQREAIWLTGLKLRALIGVSTCYKYWLACNLRRMRTKITAAIAIVHAVAALGILVFNAPGPWVQLPFMLMLIEIEFLLLMCDPRMAVACALIKIRRAIDHYDKPAATRYGFMIARTIAIWIALPYFVFLALMILFFITGIGASVWGFGWFLICIFILAAEIVRRVLPSRINKIYDDLKPNQRLYEARLMPSLFRPPLDW